MDKHQDEMFLLSVDEYEKYRDMLLPFAAPKLVQVGSLDKTERGGSGEKHTAGR